jgi:hypothetical protein
VVLDVSMPPPDGFEVCRRIREVSTVPILMLTVHDATLDKVRALDLGADDYLTKPFDHLELLARLRALIRRFNGTLSPSAVTFAAGDLTIDFATHEVRLAGNPVALVEDRVRRGLPPNSVVSVTGLPITPAIEAMRARGVLERLPMFSEILEDGVGWADGTVLRADVILWCTGFRSSLDHLAPLMLREDGGGITMTGRLATQAAKDARIHLVGYGPSASTIGANRAGAAAASELMAFLGLT